MKEHIIIIILGIVAFACNSTVQNEVPIDKAVIKKEVLKVMNAYKNAILFSDAYGVNRHYLNDPDFAFYSRNKFYNYDGMLKNMELELSKINYEGEVFKEFQVNVLNNEIVIVYSLTDFIASDNKGDTNRVTGGVTYVFVRQSDTWKIIHGIGAHKIVGD